MSVYIQGDDALLADLAEAIGKLGSPAFLAELNANLAEEARTQILLGFADSRDPYGRPWATVLRPGKPLENTGRLRNSYTVSSSTRSFRVGTNVIYAATHQHGAVIKAKKPGKPLKFRMGGPKGPWRSKYSVTIKQRMMVPEGPLGIGPIWSKAFHKIATDVIKAHLP